MTDETPEDYVQRWLRKNPAPPRVVSKPGITDRIVTAAAVIASVVLWSGLGYVIFPAATR